MDRQLKKRATQSVVWEHCTADADGYHAAQYATPVPLTCIVNEQVTYVKDAAGREYKSSTQLLFDGLLVFSSKDKLTLMPEGRSYFPIKDARYKGLRPGTGTTVVYV